MLLDPFSSLGFLLRAVELCAHLALFGLPPTGVTGSVLQMTVLELPLWNMEAVFPLECWRAPLVCQVSHLFLSLMTEIEFNVSEAFVPLATPNSNHSTHTGNDSDSGTLERKRPASMAVMEGDLVKKERYV